MPMKTIEQVKQEIRFGDVYTLEEFEKMLDDNAVSYYDGIGYFHDGEKETELSVFDDSLTYDDVKDFPYVCWYNK